MGEAFIIRYGLLSLMHLGCYLDYASHALYTNVCVCVCANCNGLFNHDYNTSVMHEYQQDH